MRALRAPRGRPRRRRAATHAPAGRRCHAGPPTARSTRAPAAAAAWGHCCPTVRHDRRRAFAEFAAPLTHVFGEFAHAFAVVAPGCGIGQRRQAVQRRAPAQPRGGLALGVEQPAFTRHRVVEVHALPAVAFALLARAALAVAAQLGELAPHDAVAVGQGLDVFVQRVGTVRRALDDALAIHFAGGKRERVFDGHGGRLGHEHVGQRHIVRLRRNAAAPQQAGQQRGQQGGGLHDGDP